MDQFRRAGEQMNMAFDETRQHRPAAGIDDFRLRAFQTIDLGDGADRQYPPVGDRDRFGAGAVIVHGKDASVDDDEIGDRGHALPWRVSARMTPCLACCPLARLARYQVKDQ